MASTPVRPRACIPLEATCPILRSPAAVGDGPDCDYGFLFGIDDGKRESPEQEPSGVVLSHRRRSGASRIVSAARCSSSMKSMAALGRRF